MKAKIIYIDKHYFGFCKDGKITYDLALMDRKRDVALITNNNWERLLTEDYTIYLYKNPNRQDGLWVSQEFVKYGFMNRAVEIKN
ncbi:MAG: hypothetical protein IPJ01_11210 [Micavibrio sp.]|nr:hypothetical protein [Micavibrio sp.]